VPCTAHSQAALEALAAAAGEARLQLSLCQLATTKLPIESIVYIHSASAPEALAAAAAEAFSHLASAKVEAVMLATAAFVSIVNTSTLQGVQVLGYIQDGLHIEA
jgi:hypothetical protein